MNRRDFLKLAVALAAFRVPKVNVQAASTIGVDLGAGLDETAFYGIVRNQQNAQRAMNEHYLAFLSPRTYDLLKKEDARSRWYAAWRVWRVACRNGYLDMSPREILATFGGPLLGEVGRFEGMQIIVTDNPVESTNWSQLK